MSDVDVKTLTLASLVKRINRICEDEDLKELVAELAARADTSYLEHADKAAQELNDASVINPWSDHLS